MGMDNYFNSKGTIGFTCDVCGREVNGCSIVNGMKFCAKCYQETFGKDNQQNEIQQLKQQLEEKDNKIKELEDYKFRNADYKVYYESTAMNYHSICEIYKNKIQELQQQLEEKDKEIERLKFFEKAYYYSQLQTSQEDIQKFQQLANQSAVNINYIAIQELEKVKKLIFEKAKENNASTSDHIFRYNIVNKVIDNQIKELKGE